MSEIRRVDGYTLEIGHHLDGDGKRVYLDGDDISDWVIDELGPGTEEPGIAVPHGDAFVLDFIEDAIANGELP